MSLLESIKNKKHNRLIGTSINIETYDFPKEHFYAQMYLDEIYKGATGGYRCRYSKGGLKGNEGRSTIHDNANDTVAYNLTII